MLFSVTALRPVATLVLCGVGRGRGCRRRPVGLMRGRAAPVRWRVAGLRLTCRRQPCPAETVRVSLAMDLDEWKKHSIKNSLCHLWCRLYHALWISPLPWSWCSCRSNSAARATACHSSCWASACAVPSGAPPRPGRPGGTRPRPALPDTPHTILTYYYIELTIAKQRIKEIVFGW